MPWYEYFLLGKKNANSANYAWHNMEGGRDSVS